MLDIKENLMKIRTLVQDCEARYGRKSGSVKLLAASKQQALEKLTLAFEAGQTIFGENYLQEALKKINFLPQVEWHFIGHVQSNKATKIAEHFSWVDSVDSQKIAKKLNDHRPAELPPLNICIEVNTSEEANKSGINKEELEELAQFCTTLPRLRLRGLMCIPAAKEQFEEQRKEFSKLATLQQSLRNKGFELDTLSMGMSHDFEAAIAEGSTIIRIGSALFGER